MAFRVLKFGGSNIRSPEDYHKIVDVVARYKQPVVLVVSAHYAFTNQLDEVIRAAKTNNYWLNSFIKNWHAFFSDILKTQIKNSEFTEEALKNIGEIFRNLKKQLLGINYIGDIPEFIYDNALCTGEKITALLLSTFFQDYGKATKIHFPENAGLITDGIFNNASVEIEQSREYLAKTFREDAINIVPGFYGVSTQGNITLFGRGGTDYSAASIAACIEAESLDLWKDVCGFRTANPKIIPESEPIQELSYQEAAELSYFGSEIIHPRTTDPVSDRNIAIQMFDIRAPEKYPTPDTIIGNFHQNEYKLRSITQSQNFGIVKLSGAGVGIKPGILAYASTALHAGGINIKSVQTSQTSINILLDKQELATAKNIIEEKDIHGVKEISMESGISLIAAVGQGIIHKPGIASRVFNAIAEKGINIRMIFFGASPVAIYFIVSEEDMENAIKSLHQALFR